MENRRIKFQKVLDAYVTKGLINKAYYSPPENIKMEYPCIVYKKELNPLDTANDGRYFNYNKYQLMIMDRRLDNPIIDDILDKFNTSMYVNEYWTDGIHHTIIELYY